MDRIFITTMVFLLLGSCNEKLVHSEYHALNNGVWEKENKIQFQFEVADTLQKHHLFLNVRNNESYEFSNLFLILELEAPNGNTLLDTLEYEMALPTGEWLGEGMGSVKESKLWYKENINFEDSGVYKVTVEQAMRKNGEVDGLENLIGITDIGLQIEKTN